MHIYVSNLTIIGSDNGLSPARRQAIIWTNAGILFIGPLGTNFSEFLTKILTFSFKKKNLKVSSGKWHPFCLGLNVLTLCAISVLRNNRMGKYILYFLIWIQLTSLNSSTPGQNGRRFADGIFRCIFSNETLCVFMKISLKFVPKGPIDNIPALVQIMAWRRSGDKPLSEPMVVCLLTHICVTQPQWVNYLCHLSVEKQ